MKVGCVILNYNDAGRVAALVDIIRNHEAIDDIILVDNCSTDDSWATLQALEGGKIHVCRTDHNGGYGSGNNCGVHYAQEVCGCDYALIVNPDVSFDNALVETLLREMTSRPDVGVASAIQKDGSGCEIGCSAWRIPRKAQYIFSTGFLLRRISSRFYFSASELHRQTVTYVDCVAGSLLMVSIPAFRKCGGYDEEIFLYCEETVLGCRMKANGYKTIVCSDCSYLHLHGVSICKSVSSAVGRKKLLIASHRLVIRRYLKANVLERFLDYVVSGIAVLETALKTALARS